MDLNSSRQVALPVSMGGVGLTRAQDISGAAWLAAQLAFLSKGASTLTVPEPILQQVPTDVAEVCRIVVQLCPSVLPAVAFIQTPELNAPPDMASDKLHWWSERIHQHLRLQLLLGTELG